MVRRPHDLTVDGRSATTDLTPVSAQAGAPVSRGRARSLGLCLVALLGLGGLFTVGYLPKLRARERLHVSAAEPAIRTVTVRAPRPLDRTRSLRLSATLAPHEQTILHARASGYLRRYLVDLGAEVKAGQLLAEIDTPELDRELDEARTRLAERIAQRTLAEASRAYARATLTRYRALDDRKLSSKQELERHEAEARMSEAQVQVAEAALSTLQATIQRLVQLRSFARVTAPFDGTVTARNIDRGALVTAGQTALFELASIDPLRIGVDVPQGWALSVTQGLGAQLSVAEYPGRSFAARVARSAGKLDAASRTLHVELEVSNPGGGLLPGMFGNLELTLEAAGGALTIPSSALLIDKEGTRVAVVGEDSKVGFHDVVIARDNGAEVELSGGLSVRDRVIVNPGSGLHAGTSVRVAR